MQLCGLESQTNDRLQGFLRRKPKGKAIKRVSFQSFLWNKHVDKHGIQDGKLHTLKQYRRSPLLTCITELKMFRLLSEAKIIYKNKG